MKDKFGLDYDELLAIQWEHLALWRERLKPKLFDEVSSYVKWANLPAGDSGRHRVFRGQDLIEIIRLWPVLGEAYPTPATNHYPGI